MKIEKSCGCIILEEDKVLLIKQTAGHWSFPKGHMEQGETEIQTAIRETKEETNLDVEIDEKYRYTTEYSPREGVWKEVVYYIAKRTNSLYIPQYSEVEKIEWFTIDEAINIITHEDSKEILKKAVKDVRNKS